MHGSWFGQCSSQLARDINLELTINWSELFPFPAKLFFLNSSSFPDLIESVIIAVSPKMNAHSTNRIMRSPPSCCTNEKLKERKIWMRSIQYFIGFSFAL